MKLNIERIIQRLDELGSISDDSRCLSRFYGTPSHLKAAMLIKGWMEEAGLKAHRDNIGNVKGILKSKSTQAKHFVIGSHYDTVFDAGKFDGPLGILLGIEMAEEVSKSDMELPFHLNVVAFADEEGARFGTAYLGSSVLIGQFNKKWLTRKDAHGKTLAQVITENGGNFDALFNEFIPQEDWLGYFEPHIEQGPVLCEKNSAVSLVTAISAQTRIEIQWTGVAGHAGTSPMDLRCDALGGAAEFVLGVEALGKKHNDRLVASVGKLAVHPNTSNVVPGLVSHSLDVRSPDNDFLNEIVENLKSLARNIAKNRSLQLDWKYMQMNPSVACDADLKKILAEALLKTGIDPLLKIPSGAGHDGVMISKVAPISMLFVRCKEGVSHNPAEDVAPEDIEIALNTCNQLIQELIDTSNSKN